MSNFLATIMPTVSAPKGKTSLKEKFMWIFIVCAIYVILGSIPLIGLAEGVYTQFELLQILTASSIGTILTLGIIPIIDASILLQILLGMKFISIDVSTSQGKAQLGALQKVLAIFFALAFSLVFVVTGILSPAQGIPQVFLFIQIFMGAILVIFLDEIITKWGFGSGIGWFILLGVAQEAIYRGFNIFEVVGLNLGDVVKYIGNLVAGNIGEIDLLFPIIFTLVIFAVVNFAQLLRVEVPLSYNQFASGHSWKLKFIYTSNIPVIFASIIIAEMGLVFNTIANHSTDIIQQIFSGLHWFVSIPPSFITHALSGTASTTMYMQSFSHILLYVVLSAMMALLWLEMTAASTPSGVASQIHKAGMSIGGFRRDPRIIEARLTNYIPYLAAMGGAFVGLLAAFANLTGAYGGGTGILLAVMIVFQLYEYLIHQYAEEFLPLLRKKF